MFPHERSLVAKMKDEPFALIGVNSDEDYAEKKKKEFVDEKITWRSFADETTGGPIAKDWEIHGWPTLFLIDAGGNLRKRWVGNPGEHVLDQAIDTLVAEAKSVKGKGAAPEKPAAPKKAGG